jgi:hypothetical protein
VLGEEPQKAFKIFLCTFDFYYEELLTVASRKMDRNCAFFVDCCWDLLSKALGQLLCTAKKVE